MKKYLYVLYAREEVHRVKIGITDNLWARMTQIQANSPVSLRLLAYSERDNAQYDEKNLHRLLSKYHVHGEWFDWGKEPRQIVENYLDIHIDHESGNIIDPTPNRQVRLA